MTPALPRPVYPTPTIAVPATTYTPPAGDAPWYPPVMAGAETLGRQHNEGDFIAASLALMARLTPDAYTTYLTNYCREGRARFGNTWFYADIVTVLLCLTRTLKPRTYLEIGVRRGRSACAVAYPMPRAAPVMTMVLPLMLSIRRTLQVSSPVRNQPLAPRRDTGRGRCGRRRGGYGRCAPRCSALYVHVTAPPGSWHLHT